MSENTDKMRDPRVYMANERTFLAWIRTSIGIMAFGFVVEKFALFMKQMPFLFGETVDVKVIPPTHGYSAILGIFLVGLGALMGLLAFIRYKKVEKQLNENMWQPSSVLDAILTIAVFVVGVFFMRMG